MSDSPPSYGVLLVAYGAPESIQDVEPYLLDVRGGRPTSPEMVAEFQERYRAIGGASPLLARTRQQADALARALGGARVYVGMRHWHPYIREVFEEIRGGGVDRVVALAMAPHFSKMSIGVYEQRIDEARGGVEAALVREWHHHPGFLQAVVEKVDQALNRFDPSVRSEVTVLFTAHSLPQRILENGDPYDGQLRASVAGVAKLLDGQPHDFAYQSAGQAGGEWLGPDAADVIRVMASDGRKHVLVCPIGFVCDHLEVLYDVDIEYQALAQNLGMHLERTESLNDSSSLIATLADLVRTTADARGWH